MKVKVTQIEQDWMVVQPHQQQSGWILEVDEYLARRWDYATKLYLGMQSEIDAAFHQQKPKHEHFE